MKCKHKQHEIKNEEIGGYNIPDGTTTEYDIYCKDCGKYLGHWAYGETDLDYHLKYKLNWWKKLLFKIHIKITDIKLKIKYRKYDDNGDLPF